MKVTSSIILLILAAAIFSGCEDEKAGEQTHHPLPLKFPLVAGTAWVYEKHEFISESDTAYLDTLYIPGMDEEYHKFSWEPEQYYMKVRNRRQKLLYCGRVFLEDGDSLPDTVYFDLPIILAFFGEDSGMVHLEDSTNYSGSYKDRKISIIEDFEMLDGLYDTYLISQIKLSTGNVVHEIAVNADGIAWTREFFPSTGTMYRESVMKEKLTDFYPVKTLRMNSE